MGKKVWETIETKETQGERKRKVRERKKKEKNVGDK